MPGKWTTTDIQVGKLMETTFWANTKDDSPYPYRAIHLDGRRAPKIVLSDDPRIRIGVPSLVRIKSIDKRTNGGKIEVEWVHSDELRLEGVWVDPVLSRKLQVLLESGTNILLDGPQGSGKTTLARAVAQALHFEFVFFNCSAVVEATDFLATMQVRAGEGGQPVTEFVKTELLVALEVAATKKSRRFLVFLDELNRCQESARNSLMPALDATRRIFNPITASFLEIPDNVQFIAAVNRGSEFSGTFGIDAAQLDRFAPLLMDYPPADEEVKILEKRHPELEAKVIRKVVEIAGRLRSSPELTSGLSVRATDEVCLYLKHPVFEEIQDRSFGDILKTSFCGRYQGRWNDSSTDAGAAWGIISAMLREGKKGN
jgi:MoxR-like ATPase